VHRREHGDASGIDTRQLGRIGGEDFGQHGGQILQQMKAVGHLARRGRPHARRFRVRLCPIPYVHLDPRVCLQPLRHGRGFPVGEEGQGPPPFEIQQEGAVGVALAQGEIVYTEDLRRANRRVGGAADHPQQRVTTHQESEVPTEPHPGRPTQRQAHGEETCRQPQSLPGPGRHKSRQALGEDAAWACRIAAEQFADAEPPGDPVSTPGEIGQCPSVMTVDMPGRGIAPWASGVRLCGSDQEGNLGLGFINAPGLEVKRYDLGQQMGQRVSNLHECKGPILLQNRPLVYTGNREGTASPNVILLAKSFSRGIAN
jgi:hypothetical protein